MEDNNTFEEKKAEGTVVYHNRPLQSVKKDKKKKNRSYMYGVMTGIWISVILFAAGNLIGWLVGKTPALGKNIPTISSGKTEEMVTTDTTRKMMAIEDVIHKFYLEDTDAQTLEDGVYSGMIEALGDPYSAYFSVEELKEMEQDVEGIYYGIGAYVGIDTATQLPVVSGVIEGTPAEEAQLRDGDLIYKVDDTLTQGMDTSDVVALIRGQEHTTVHLTLIREGEDDYVEVDVTRRKVESPTVSHEMLDNNIAYIQITEFDTVTVDQFAEALAVCKGSGMEGLILDLRSNPGGSLSAVCEIARKILPKGLIVYTEDKYGEREELTCDGKNEIQVPMVVLINDYSASASEILAGAIQDYEKGILMGTTTYGKGIVQRIISLSDGSAVKLTISNYYTPKGRNIHKVGVEPDVLVEFDGDAYYNEGFDNQLEEAVKYMEEQLLQAAE